MPIERSSGRQPHRSVSRREFLHALGPTVAAAGASVACSRLGLRPVAPVAPPTSPTEVSPIAPFAPTEAGPSPTPSPASLRGVVALVATEDRASGVRRALDLLGANPVQGRRVFLKPNFNSADPAPGSTHPDVLRALDAWSRDSGAESITIGDRSGMGDTRRVMEDLGIFELADELGWETVIFDDLEADDWIPQPAAGTHWARGFALARPAVEAEAMLMASCLKTHRYGGHFTLSLKNSVGLAASRIPGEGYAYMNELHSSPDQRTMIAELNAAFTPALTVLDGVEAFVTGGPDTGQRVASRVVLVGHDRVALDAAGVAVLRLHGTTPEVSQGPVFGQTQIARAVELGLGVERAEDIQFVTDDPESAAYATRLEPILQAS